MKFLKQYRVAVLSIGAIVLSLLLLLIPGFAHFEKIGDDYQYLANGYQFFFNLKAHNGEVASKFGTGNVKAGIAIIVLSGLALIMFCLTKFSSFFVLMGGLMNLTNSILFFSMEASANKVYPPHDDWTTCGWVTYFIGALLVIAAGYALYKAVLMMRDEIKHPAQPKGPSYNYLKK